MNDDLAKQWNALMGFIYRFLKDDFKELKITKTKTSIKAGCLVIKSYIMNDCFIQMEVTKGKQTLLTMRNYPDQPKVMSWVLTGIIVYENKLHKQ